VAAVGVEGRGGERDVLLGPGEAQRVDARVAEHGVEREGEGLVEIVLLARGVERHRQGVRGDDLVVLRRGLAQPAHAPAVVLVDLVVESHERVPDPRLAHRCGVQVGPGRDRDVLRQVLDHALQAHEEVRLVLDHRAAEREAVLLELGVGLLQVVLLREVVLLGQRGVLDERESAAAEAVGPALRDRVDDRAGGAPELGVVLVGQYLELLDRLERRPRLGPGALADHVVVVVPAVEQVVVVAGILAVDAHGVGAKRLRRDVGDDARQQADEPDVVAVDRGQVGELAVVDVSADLLRGDVDDRRLRRHRQLLAHSADLQAHVDRGRLADLEPDVALADALEARELRGELVGSGQDAGQVVASVAGRTGLAEDAAPLVLDDDRHSGQRCPLLIRHAPAQLGRALLGEGARGGKARDEGEERTGDRLDPHRRILPSFGAPHEGASDCSDEERGHAPSRRQARAASTRPCVLGC